MTTKPLNLRRLALPILACIAASGLACRANHLDLWTWDQLAAPTTNHLAKIIYANGAFLAVGSGGTILRSSNGLNWNVMPSPTTNELVAVTFANDLFVAVGNSGTIVTSTNGVHWALRPIATSLHLTSVAFGNGRFVVPVWGSAAVLSSTNGADWVIQAQTGAGASTSFEGLAFANGVFFSVAGDFFHGSEIYRSTDGMEWQTLTNYSSSVNLDGIKNVGGQLIASAWNGIVATSQDAGTTWTLQIAVPTCPSCQNVSDVAFGDGRFVLVATRSLRFDSSAQSWSWSNPFDFWFGSGGVVYGNGAFVAVGRGGVIFRSRSRLQLGIEQAGTNVVLSWPTNSHAVAAEKTSVLPNGIWSPIPGLPVTFRGDSVLTNAIQPGGEYFRLRFDE